MNSTSAAASGGNTAREEDGRVLLGIPGAPGCTTTGLDGSACSASATPQKIVAVKLIANNNRRRTCFGREEIFIVKEDGIFLGNSKSVGGSLF